MPHNYDLLRPINNKARKCERYIESIISYADQLLIDCFFPSRGYITYIYRVHDAIRLVTISTSINYRSHPTYVCIYATPTGENYHGSALLLETIYAEALAHTYIQLRVHLRIRHLALTARVFPSKRSLRKHSASDCWGLRH